MGGEDRAVLLAQLLGDAVAIALDLGGGGGDGLIEPLQLVLDRVARQEPTRDAKSLVVHDEHFADRHAGRNGNPLKTFHVVLAGTPAESAKSPVPLANRAVTRMPCGQSSVLAPRCAAGGRIALRHCRICPG